MNTIYQTSGLSRAPRHQKGMATLLVSIMLVLLITIGVFSGSRMVISEVKATQNTYWSTRALQAADGGVDYAIAWLSQTANDPVWVADHSVAPNDQKGAPITYSEGSYTVTATPYRQSGSSTVQLVATATGTDHSRATVQQQVALLGLLSPHFNNAPLVINGCLSGVTGNPVASQNGSGVSIASSQAGGCIALGHMNITGTIEGNAFTGSAWNAVFGVTTDDLKLFASSPLNQQLMDQGGGVYFYDSTNPAPNNFHQSVGTQALPAVIVFGPGSGCPKINGSPTIYGIVYYDASCASQDPGWGGATIHGTVVVDGSVTKFTANSQLLGANLGNNDFKIPYLPVRILGSWRDF